MPSTDREKIGRRCGKKAAEPIQCTADLDIRMSSCLPRFLPFQLQFSGELSERAAVGKWASYLSVFEMRELADC